MSDRGLALRDPARLLEKSRGRYRTLAFSAILMGGCVVTWTLERRGFHAGSPALCIVREWLAYGGALPLLVVVCGASLYAASLARRAGAGGRTAGYAAWRVARFVYWLFAATVAMVMLFGLVEVVFSRGFRTGALLGLLGTAVWGAWYLTAMRDQISLFGHASNSEDAPATPK